MVGRISVVLQAGEYIVGAGLRKPRFYRLFGPGLSVESRSDCNFSLNFTRREFLREILYKNIAIIAIQRSKMDFVDTFGYFSHTVE